MIYTWFTDNYLEIFGAVTGILYVFLEIRQTLWLWPVGIVTSAVYIWVFFTGKLYADMSLQVYYLAISVFGWYWWASSERGRRGEREKGRVGDGETGRRGEWEKGSRSDDVAENIKGELEVSRLELRTGIVLSLVFVFLYSVMWFILSRFTDSPVPGWDSFITSMSIVATWMLARKIYEHWYLWIVVNFVAATLFLVRGLYPTVILYIVYGIMSFAGLAAWKKTILKNHTSDVVEK